MVLTQICTRHWQCRDMYTMRRWRKKRDIEEKEEKGGMRMARVVEEGLTVKAVSVFRAHVTTDKEAVTLVRDLCMTG